jgi:hypothetical protein
MMTEMEQITYNDILSDIASTMEQYGVLKLLGDFKEYYPRHYEELVAQVDRKTHHKQIPRLCMPDEPQE